MATIAQILARSFLLHQEIIADVQAAEISLEDEDAQTAARDIAEEGSSLWSAGAPTGVLKMPVRAPALHLISLFILFAFTSADAQTHTIGYLTDTQGPGSSWSIGSTRGAQLGVEDFNLQHPNTPVTLIFEEHQAKNVILKSPEHFSFKGWDENRAAKIAIKLKCLDKQNFRECS